MDAQGLEERLSTSLLGAADALTVVLGERLGLYAALARAVPPTAEALARATRTEPRLLREWLEQQTSSRGSSPWTTRSRPRGPALHLPPEHVPLLAEPDRVGYFPPVLAVLAAAGERLTAVEQAFHDGGGVAWSAYGAQMRPRQGAANRPLLLQVLPQRWLPLVPGLAERLGAGARVADVGAGEGWASIGIARPTRARWSTRTTSTRTPWSPLASTSRSTGPGDPMEQLFHAYLVLVCLPDSLSHPGSVGTGTVMRRGTLETYARAAGFARVEEVEVDDETFRLLELVT